MHILLYYYYYQYRSCRNINRDTRPRVLFLRPVGNLRTGFIKTRCLAAEKRRLNTLNYRDSNIVCRGIVEYS